MVDAKADLIVRGGRVVSATGSFMADISVRDGRIAAIGDVAGAGRIEIDARNRLVLPGGVDTHCHIQQMSGAGIMNADTFESATRSALYGGTTTVVSFAAQHKGMRLSETVRDYALLAQQGAMTDYAFHMIVADPSGANLSHDLPELIGEGNRSIKIFTTYEKVRLGDEEILDLLWCARSNGAMVCIHAENDGLIRWMTKRLLAQAKTLPKHHALSHARMAEIEALERMCRFSEFTGQPVMLFHVSTKEGVDVVRAARARGVRAWAETCPHYLLQTSAILEGATSETAKYLCSPPQRSFADQEALWRALASGDIQIVSSDHASYRMDASGKFAHGFDAPFTRIANGMPGLETRLPLLFQAAVGAGRLGVEQFVRVTATAPAEMFGLSGKGKLIPGADADIVVWDPEKRSTYGVDDLHDNTGYNPYAGASPAGLPETVVSRGEIVLHDGKFTASPGRGLRIPMALSDCMRPAAPASEVEG